MDLADVRILYLRELRAALRERGIVNGSLLMPVLLYPVTLWVMFTAMVFIRGQEERFTSRVVLVDLPAAHHAFREQLTADASVELLADGTAGEASETDWGERVAAGEIDAVAEVLAAEGADASLDDNFRLRLTYDGSKDRSLKARERLESTLDSYRDGWVRRRAEALGVDDREWRGVVIERLDLATGGEKGAFFLGLIVPFLMIIMIAMGCFYPAVDATAGERERSTWETTMTVAASRVSIVVAKYLYVATLGGTAGILNLLAMTLSMRLILGPMLGRGSDLQFQIPYAALPLLALTAVMLALFIAAGMMIFASFARNFKEGQSMVGPFYMMCILPVLFVQSPDLELDTKLALVPIVNVALLFRQAIGGVYHWPLIALTLAVTALTVAACLALARFILGFEDLVLGSYSGNLASFLRRRLLRRGASALPREVPP